MPNSNNSSAGRKKQYSFRNCCIHLAMSLCLQGAVWLALPVNRGLEAGRHISSNVPAPIAPGAQATFLAGADDRQGPANGRCEIVAPHGAVVASFVSIAGGWDNGWGAQVQYNGWNERPTFTVTAPENAPTGAGYRISVASYLWPQSSALFEVVANNAPVVSSSPSPFGRMPTVTPVSVSQADLVIRNATDRDFLGQDLYGDEGEDQTAEQVAVENKTSVYLIEVRNRSEVTATFNLNAQSSGKGWAIRYFDMQQNGKDISEFIFKEGWQMAPLPAEGHTVLRVEISAGNAADVAATTLLHVLNTDGVALDAVRATATRQSIERIEVSVNQGKTWRTATARGVSVSESAVVGFRAIKKNPKLPWPDEPLKPEWHTQEASHSGDAVWIQGATDEDTILTAQCGNAVTTKIHVMTNQATPPRKYLLRKKPWKSSS